MSNKKISELTPKATPDADDLLPIVDVNVTPYASKRTTVGGIAAIAAGLVDFSGVIGYTGPTGPTGATGPAGPQGAQGVAGIGLPGPTGPTGPSGLVGDAGATGATGPQGPAGSAGQAGATGPSGLVGDAGATGATGPQGPAGSAGQAGATGPQGPAGVDGNSVTILGVVSTWPPADPNTSNVGDLWIAVEPIPSGAPVGTTAGDGIMWSGSSWINIGSIGGPAGATGATGPAGPAGSSGAIGADGPTGATGPAGAIGPIGPAGVNGTNGASGPTGATGPIGPAGSNGTEGATGATGPQGPAGANGIAGPTGATGPVGPAGSSGIAGPTGATGVGATGATGPQGATGPAGPSGSGGNAWTRLQGSSFVANSFTASAGGQYYLAPTDVASGIDRTIADPADPAYGSYYLVWNQGDPNGPFVGGTRVTSGQIIARIFTGAALPGWTTKILVGDNSVGVDYEFTVNFSSGAPSSVVGLPTGWSASISSNDVTITHNMGKQVKDVTYWGYTSTSNLWRARYPTASNELTMSEDTKTSAFKIRISNTVVAAESNGTARIVCFF